MIAANAGNVLAAIVTARLTDADSAAVRFRAAGAATDSLTPATTVTADSVTRSHSPCATSETS